MVSATLRLHLTLSSAEPQTSAIDRMHLCSFANLPIAHAQFIRVSGGSAGTLVAAARGRGGKYSLGWMIRYEEGSWVVCPVVTFEWFLADSPTHSHRVQAEVRLADKEQATISLTLTQTANYRLPDLFLRIRASTTLLRKTSSGQKTER